MNANHGGRKEDPRRQGNPCAEGWAGRQLREIRELPECGPLREYVTPRCRSEWERRDLFGEMGD